MDERQAEIWAILVEQKPEYTFDPDKVLEEIKLAGFNSVAEVPVIHVGGTTGFLPRSKECVEYVVEQFNKMGFKTEVKWSDVAGMIDDLFSEATPKPGFIFHLSWGNGTGDPHHSLVPLYRSPGAWTGTSDAKTDELVDKGMVTVDLVERAKVYAELQAHLWDTMPHIPLNNSDSGVGYSKRVQGMVHLGVGRLIFHSAYVAG